MSVYDDVMCVLRVKTTHEFLCCRFKCSVLEFRGMVFRLALASFFISVDIQAVCYIMYLTHYRRYDFSPILLTDLDVNLLFPKRAR